MKAELICSACGSANSPTAKFCSECATPLRGATPPAGLTGLLPANALLNTRYLIVKRVGKGGMGAVYQAADTRLSSKVWAIKEMSDTALPDPVERQQAREAFQREAQMLATLDHPNLPKVNDFFIESGKLYLVMDYIDGRTLKDVLEASPSPLPEAYVLRWIGQVCDVLDYLHRCTPPIIFRDLKPDNIMVERGNRVKLIDFGVARLFKSGKQRDTESFGTAGYAPPEQYGQGQTDARSDIYALGVTLHELLTRYDPALTPFNLPPARKVNPAVSARVEQAISKATQTLPANRFQHALEMKAALLMPNRPESTLIMPAVAQPQSHLDRTVIMPSAARPQPHLEATVIMPSAARFQSNLETTVVMPSAARPQPAMPQSGQNPTVRPPLSFEPEMIVIPAGEFWMGSDQQQDQNARVGEMPQHRVYLDEYTIGKYSVTQAQYLAFVQATDHRVPEIFLGGPANWDKTQRRPPVGKENHPVVLVDWNDAATYCQWLAQVTGRSYRLPTEAEWEKAARGTDQRLYPWGNVEPDQSRVNFDTHAGGATEVGKHPASASPYGVLDMVGNVWEWVADWYSERYYASSPARNPRGPGSGNYRAARGGAWNQGAINLRVSYRQGNSSNDRNDSIGFRCACGATS